MAIGEKRPRILEKKGWLDFRDSHDNNVALLNLRNHTIEDLEGAYNGIQRSFEDDETIGQHTYLQWARILYRKGLEIDVDDQMALGIIRDEKQEYFRRFDEAA